MDSAIHLHVSFLPQTPLPSRLPQNIEFDLSTYACVFFFLAPTNIYSLIFYKCEKSLTGINKPSLPNPYLIGVRLWYFSVELTYV